MEAINHFDLVGRLKADIETYAVILTKASAFVKQCDSQGALSHITARNELGTKFEALTRELDLLGRRFRTNRLVDLATNQSVNTQTLGRVYDIALEEKLERWLESPPNMKQKQLETQKLRKEGTGLWLLESTKFINWQDNSGTLWIRGPSGAGKSVLSSIVISKLIEDRQLFTELGESPSPPAVTFFYFDFKDKEGQAVESALRRLVLQLSSQSPHLHKALDQQYKLSNGQTLPTFHDLLKVLKELLLQLQRTYIVLDALDECREPDLEPLLNLISTLRSWTRTPVHLLITSQPRTTFKEEFNDVPCIELDSVATQKDIKLFVSSELRVKRSLSPWIAHAEYIGDRIVRKSSGMFRLAACLLVEISRRWLDPNDLDKLLDHLPTDLFGIYNRFLEAIHPDDFVYVEGILRWLICSARRLTLAELADAIAFNFSNPTQYVYNPSRREGNKAAILRWLEGLVVVNHSSRGSWVVLAHASVRDYVLSKGFTEKFGRDLNAGLSHTFIAHTCIAYFLQFSTPECIPLETYPLAKYAAQNWCHHLLRCHDRPMLFPAAMCLLEDGSNQHRALDYVYQNLPFSPTASPLHLCCNKGYIEGVRGVLANGADVNQEIRRGTPLGIALDRGHTDIVRVLLENGANPNAFSKQYGNPLQLASAKGDTEAVDLLLKNGANHFGGALHSACSKGHAEIVRLLLASGADLNTVGGSGNPLQIASSQGHTEVVYLLLESGADINVEGGEYGTVLNAASAGGKTEVVKLLLDHGADINAVVGRYDTALQGASFWGHTETVHLLLERGAAVNPVGGKYLGPLQLASRNGHTEIVEILRAKGAVVTGVAADQSDTSDSE
ncbi:hypothetical protein FB451DRAFT_576023 [Mycena latifolia]|nr:hypothetical protein FB451DRAFT_576023 [Mycena latifolia]